MGRGVGLVVEVTVGPGVGEAIGLELPKFIDVYPDALDLLKIAEQGFAKGLAQPIDEIELVYLRGADAWQKRKRIRAS